MPRYDYLTAARSFARFALAALIGLGSILLTDMTATATHWSIALPVFCAGILGVVFVTDPERI